MPRVLVPSYQERIPAVLVMLQHHFTEHNGHVVPYIFRESPGKTERDRAMAAINTGTFRADEVDVRIIADLIKVWFRELPVPLLHQVPMQVMEHYGAIQSKDVNDDDDGDDNEKHTRTAPCPHPHRRIDPCDGALKEENQDDSVVDAPSSAANHPLDTPAIKIPCLGALEHTILLWLADLLLVVASFSSVNHMGIDQLAIILAPNLIRIDTPNPMVAVTMSKASVDFLRHVLKERHKQNHDRMHVERPYEAVHLPPPPPPQKE